MEQTLLKQDSEAEVSVEPTPEHNVTFNERELVLEQFANTPMAYTVKGTTHKVNGSYEAVMLCDFLQNEKVPAALLAIKFQEAADFSATLDAPKPNETDTPANEEVNPSSDVKEAGNDVSADKAESSDSSSKSKASDSKTSATDNQMITTAPDARPEPALIEKVSPVPIVSRNDSDATPLVSETKRKEESKETKTENTISHSPSIVSDQPVVGVIKPLSSEGLQNDELDAEPPVVDDSPAPEVKDGEQHATLIVPDVVSEEPSEIEEIPLPQPSEHTSIDPELEIVDVSELSEPVQTFDADAVTIESEEASVDDTISQTEITFEEPKDLTLFEELSEDNSHETLPNLTVSDGEDTPEPAAELEPEQEIILNDLNELLITLSSKSETQDTDDLETEDVPVIVPAERIDRLYKCLEAQVNSLSEDDDSAIDKELLVDAVRDTLVEIATEADIDNPELFAELYLERYGVSGLLDIIQPPLPPTQDSNRLIEQCSKIAQFTMMLLVDQEKPATDYSLKFANAA